LEFVLSVDSLFDDLKENKYFQLLIITIEKLKKKVLIKSFIHFLSYPSVQNGYFYKTLVQLIKKVKQKNLLFTCLLLLYTSNGLIAQQLHTYIDTDTVSVGDRITYIIVFDGNYDSIIYPEESQFEQELDWLDRERFQISANRDSLVYHLQFFGTGNLLIESKEVQVSTSEGDTTLYTVEIPLFFNTVIEEGDEEFRPFKPIFDFARNWLLIFLLFISTTIFIFFLYRWYQKRETVIEKPKQQSIPPDPFLNPLDLLKNELSNLSDTSGLSTIEDYERFYVSLGDAIRAYLKRVYGITALEMTTREIIDSLHRELATSDIIKMTRKVLNDADMVKFANFQPTIEQAESVLKQAHAFAETAAIVDNDKIRYMKHKHEEKLGLKNQISTQKEEQT